MGVDFRPRATEFGKRPSCAQSAFRLLCRASPGSRQTADNKPDVAMTPLCVFARPAHKRCACWFRAKNYSWNTRVGTFQIYRG